MRRWFVILLLTCFVGVYAQESVFTGKLHEDILTVRWGGIRQYDEYLSPLKYKGQFIALQNEWWQMLTDACKLLLQKRLTGLREGFLRLMQTK